MFFSHCPVFRPFQSPIQQSTNTLLNYGQTLTSLHLKQNSNAINKLQNSSHRNKFHCKAKIEIFNKNIDKLSNEQNSSVFSQNLTRIIDSKYCSSELSQVLKICSNYQHEQQNNKNKLRPKTKSAP